MTAPKYCVDCKNEHTESGAPKYRRCTKAPDAPHDAGLCGAMRRADGACGPDASLWEAK